MYLGLLMDPVTCPFTFRRQGLCLLVRMLPARGSRQLLAVLPWSQPCCAPAEGVRAMLGCGPEGDTQGRSTHKLRENGAMEVFCKAAVLLGRSLVDLQITLVWGGQQQCLRRRKPSDLTCRSCPTLANASVTYPSVPKDTPASQPGCSVLVAQWD